MNLQDHPKYVRDLNKYNKHLQSIKDSKDKIYFQKLLAQLKQQVQVIEDSHSIGSIKRITPKETKANLEELIFIRQQLDRICRKG